MTEKKTASINQSEIDFELHMGRRAAVRKLLYKAITNNDLPGLRLILGNPGTALEARYEICSEDRGARIIASHVNNLILKDLRCGRLKEAAIKQQMLEDMKSAAEPRQIPNPQLMFELPRKFKPDTSHTI